MTKHKNFKRQKATWKERPRPLGTIDLKKSSNKTQIDKNTKRQELWTDKLIKLIDKNKKTRVMDRQSYQIDSQEQKKTWVKDRQTYRIDRLKV